MSELTDKQKELLDRVARRWHLDGRVPLPKGEWMYCGACGAGPPSQHLRSWRFGQYGENAEKTWRYRCDVAFKCTDCSLVYVFGVATPQEMSDFWGTHTEITYREWDRFDEEEFLAHKAEQEAAREKYQARIESMMQLAHEDGVQINPEPRHGRIVELGSDD